MKQCKQWLARWKAQLAGAKGSKAAFRHGTMASILTACVLAVVVLLNLVMGALPSAWTQFDISHSGLYSVGDTTKQLLSQLQEDVTFYYLAQTGQEDESILTFLQRYTEESSHLHWEQKDPAIYPTFAQQYDAADASQGSILVVSGQRSKLVDAQDLYAYDYSNYYTTGSYDVQFDGEQQLTSAVYYVTTEDLPKIYQLTGHGEQSLTSSQQNALAMQNIQLESLSLVSAESIPEDASALLVAGPTVDYTQEDVQVLRSYLEQGGNLMVLTDSSVSTPNLDSLMAEFGMERQQGLVVEGNSSYHARGYNYYLLPKVQSHESTSGLDDLYVMLPYAQAIQFSELENVTQEELLRTSSSAYNKAAGYEMTTTEKEAGDIEGPFVVGAAAVRTNEDESESKLIWLTSAGMMQEYMDYAVGGGNSQLLLGCASWMNGQDSGILIAAKSLSGDVLTVNAAQSALWGNLTTLVLPVGCLVAGAVITIRRRRRA